MANKKFYVVFEGKKTGIYETWAECQSQTKGVSGSKFKSFPTREEAEKAFASYKGHKELTKEEIEELIDGCSWEFTLKNDVKVCIGTSKINGNSICFPLAGIRTDGEEIELDFPIGGYWSSSLDTSDDDCAEGIYFGWDGDDTEVESGALTTRYMGCSIRGVCK